MKQITVMELLRDEEKHLLDRLAFIRRRIKRIESGELVAIDDAADVAGDALAWMKAQATVTQP